MIKINSSLAKKGLSPLSFVWVAVLWMLLSYTDDSGLIPSLREIFSAIFEYRNQTSDIFSSLASLLPGLLLGTVIGILVGLFTGRNKIVDQLLSPVLDFIRAMPPVALAPIFIVLFGIGYLSNLIIIGIGVFFPVWVSSHEGVRSLPDRLKILSKDYNIRGLNRYKLIILPHAATYIASGIRIAIGLSLVMLFISEWIASTDGIGYRMALAHTLGNMEDLIAGVILLGLISLAIDQCFIFFVKKLLPWVGK